MSVHNSGLASLTANYSDSEDEDASPVPFTHDVNQSDEDSRGAGGVSSHDSSSQDCLKPPQSVESAGSGGENVLVAYNVEGDPIDNEIIEDFPGGLKPNLAQDHTTGSPVQQQDVTMKSATNSPLQASLDTETVSSEDDMISAPKKKIKLPPEPTTKCSAKLQERFNKMYEGRMKGTLNMNEVIQTKKMFRNPSIYEKLISHLGIDEFGTNYPESVFNPHEWLPASYYDELAKVQKAEMDRREKERRDRTKVDFVSGTAKKSLPAISAVSAPGSHSEGDTKKKSKWDQKGVMPPLLMMGGGPSQPVTLPASIINSVNNATKSKTVVTISAFGSLPKKVSK